MLEHQNALKLLGAAIVTALVLMACEQGPVAEHTHDPQPTRPAVQTHVITVRSADFLNDSPGLAVAGYEVSALTQGVVNRGEIHAYIKTRGSTSWDTVPYVLITTSGASLTINVSYEQDVVLVAVIGTVVNRAVLDIFFPASLRLVIDQGSTS